MTPENQRDEEIKIYYDDEYITVTEAISKLTPEEIDRGNHCDQTIIDLISAITSLRQSWEREKREIIAELLDWKKVHGDTLVMYSVVRKEKEALEKEKAGLEERVRELEIENGQLKAQTGRH